jgi:hypothetical protein
MLPSKKVDYVYRFSLLGEEFHNAALCPIMCGPVGWFCIGNELFGYNSYSLVK